MGSGCGRVGRTAASNIRDPRFDSSHWQFLYRLLLTANIIEKTKIKKTRPGRPILKRRKKWTQEQRLWHSGRIIYSKCMRIAFDSTLGIP